MSFDSIELCRKQEIRLKSNTHHVYLSVRSKLQKLQQELSPDGAILLWGHQCLRFTSKVLCEVRQVLQYLVYTAW